jgi:hypothetical protein
VAFLMKSLAISAIALAFSEVFPGNKAISWSAVNL